MNIPDEALRGLLADNINDPLTRLVLADRLEELGRHAEAALCRGNTPLFVSKTGQVQNGTIRAVLIYEKTKAILGPWDIEFCLARAYLERIAVYTFTLSAPLPVMMRYKLPLSRQLPSWPTEYEDKLRKVIRCDAREYAIEEGDSYYQLYVPSLDEKNSFDVENISYRPEDYERNVP